MTKTDEQIEAEAHRRFPAHHHDGYNEGEPLPSPVVSSEGQEFDPVSPRVELIVQDRLQTVSDYRVEPGSHVTFNDIPCPLTDYQRAGLKARGWLQWPRSMVGTHRWTRMQGDFGPYAEEGDSEWDDALEDIWAQEPVPDPAQAGLAPDANPKDKSAMDKVPMETLPSIGAVHGAMATGEGIRKGHGFFNWRETPISLKGHIAAIERHIAAIKDGEDYVRDCEGRRVTHLGCINAGTAIILDARQCGTLIDDRPEAFEVTAADEMEAYHERNKR